LQARSMVKELPVTDRLRIHVHTDMELLRVVVRFFGSKGSIKFVIVLEPSNCSSSSMYNSEMEDFSGFHGHTRPKHACNVCEYNKI